MVPTARGLTVTKAESSGAQEPNETPGGNGHFPPWPESAFLFTQGLNSDFQEQLPGGARGAPLAALEAFRVREHFNTLLSTMNKPLGRNSMRK